MEATTKCLSKMTKKELYEHCKVLDVQNKKLQLFNNMYDEQYERFKKQVEIVQQQNDILSEMNEELEEANESLKNKLKELGIENDEDFCCYEELMKKNKELEALLTNNKEYIDIATNYSDNIYNNYVCGHNPDRPRLFNANNELKICNENQCPKGELFSPFIKIIIHRDNKIEELEEHLEYFQNKCDMYEDE